MTSENPYSAAPADPCARPRRKDELFGPTLGIGSEPELKALRLALNRIPQDTRWDSERLRADFSALLTLSFDTELTGFEVVEIDALVDVDVPTANVVESPDAIPAASADPVTRLGDVWLCGRHRVACGDALDGTALALLVDGERPAMAFCDPPYNLPVDGFVSGLGRTHHREFRQGSGEMTSVVSKTSSRAR